MNVRRSAVSIGLVAALGSSCEHRGCGADSGKTEASSDAGSSVLSARAPETAAARDVAPGTAVPDASAGSGAATRPDGGGRKGCKPGEGSGTITEKRWLTFFDTEPFAAGERSLYLDVDREAYFASDGNLALVQFHLPAKERCERVLSEADVASFEQAVRDADLCALPAHSPSPDPRQPAVSGFSVSDPSYIRWRQRNWRMFLCTDFGERCSIERRADEWTTDPKLKRLLGAIEALVRATCR